tara:strand:- start:264 stop:383 length:120 start_codon:yes stop_codon:yes gene_type:complete
MDTIIGHLIGAFIGIIVMISVGGIAAFIVIMLMNLGIKK